MCGKIFKLALGLVFALSAKATEPGHLDKWVELLRRAAPENPPLSAAVSKLLNDGRATLDPEPALVAVTYRQHGNEVCNVVVYIYNSPSAGVAAILNPHGTVRSRLGDDLGDSADDFLSLLGSPADGCLGPEVEAKRQQRAYNAAFAGDLTLLREQTVEPLYVVVILPRAGRYLPSGLASRVNTLIVSAELNFGEWRGRIGFVTDNSDSADQVGNVISAWRDLAGSLAETYAGYSSGRRLRESITATKIEVTGNQVTATGVVPAMTMVRVAKEMAGHGGGCAPGAPCTKDKVAICHKQQGHPDQTLCVAPSAVAAHLAHGDYCGPCRTGGDDHGNERGH